MFKNYDVCVTDSCQTPADRQLVLTFNINKISYTFSNKYLHKKW